MDTTFDIFESTIFDNKIINANDHFLNKYVAVLEATCDDDVFTEKHQATVGEALRIFIAEIISTIQQIKDVIQDQIESAVRSKQFKAKLESLKDELHEKEATGEKTIEMVDFIEIRDTYKDMVESLRSQVNKINNVDYLTHFGLDHSIDSFYKKIDDYNDELEELMSTKKKMKIADAIKFVEEETSGSGYIIKSLNDAIGEFKSLEKTVKQMELKERIVGKDLIAKNVVIVRQSSNAFVKAIRKWSSRIIARCVFIFA